MVSDVLRGAPRIPHGEQSWEQIEELMKDAPPEIVDQKCMVRLTYRPTTGLHDSDTVDLPGRFVWGMLDVGSALKQAH